MLCSGGLTDGVEVLQTGIDFIGVVEGRRRRCAAVKIPASFTGVYPHLALRISRIIKAYGDSRRSVVMIPIQTPAEVLAPRRVLPAFQARQSVD